MNKKTLVLGASLKPNRYSNFALQKLVNNNVETVAFGLKKGDVAGVTIDTALVRVIFNPGTENPEFYSILKTNGIYFEEACTLVLLSTNQY